MTAGFGLVKPLTLITIRCCNRVASCRLIAARYERLVTRSIVAPWTYCGKPGGLLVEVTDGTYDYNAARYRISVFYDLAKISVNRLAFSEGHELTPHHATAVSVTPGWLRSEMMLENYGVSESRWRDALSAGASPRAPLSFALSESPRYVGRGVAALAADPDRHRWHQRSVTSGQLAAASGFTDVDGSQPDVWKYNEDVERGMDADPSDYR